MEREMSQGSSRNAMSERRRTAAIRPDASGQDLAEYAILIGGIALLVIASVGLFGQSLLSLWQQITGTLPF